MAVVNVLNVTVLDNPSRFTNPFQFEITFDCLRALPDDLEWKVIYVGSPESSDHDQELDSVLVGPVPVGTNKFVFQADPPDHLQIPNLLGVTVVLLTCSYRDKEFIRIGYYVNVEYPGGAAAVAPGAAAGGGAAMDEGGVEAMEEDGGMETEVDQVLPANYDIADVTRSILAEKPRVTRFEVDWS